MYLQALKQLPNECEHKAIDAETNRNDRVKGAIIAGFISAKIREHNKAPSMEMADNNSQTFNVLAVNEIYPERDSFTSKNKKLTRLRQ